MEALPAVDSGKSQRHLIGCEKSHEALASQKATARSEGETKAHDNERIAEVWTCSRCL